MKRNTIKSSEQKITPRSREKRTCTEAANKNADGIEKTYIRHDMTMKATWLSVKTQGQVDKDDEKADDRDTM